MLTNFITLLSVSEKTQEILDAFEDKSLPVDVVSTAVAEVKSNSRAQSYLAKLRDIGFMKSKSLVFPLKES